MNINKSILKNQTSFVSVKELLRVENILKNYQLKDYEEKPNVSSIDLIITIEQSNAQIENLNNVHSLFREELSNKEIINITIKINLFKCKIEGTIEELSHKINFAEECDICVNTDSILNNDKKSECRLDDIKFKKCRFDKIYIKNSSYNHIIFKSNDNIIENLRIENIDNNKDCKFIFNRVGLKLLSIKNATFNNDFIIQNNFEEDTKFFIEDSIFEKNFFYTRCNSRKNFFLKNVTFNSNVNLSNTTVKDISLEEVYFDESKTIDFTGFTILYKKEINSSTFRKIKLFLEKRGNKIESNEYHSYEMKARKFGLKYKGTIEEKIVFFLNDNISNHGLSWLQTLFWVLVIGFFYSGTFMSSININSILEYHIIPLVLTSIFSYFFITFMINMKENNREEVVKQFSTWQMGLIYYVMIFIRFCLPLICAVYFYFSINEFDIKPFFNFINVIDFNKSNVSYETKTISRLIMIYLIYHFIIAWRKDTKK